jgi:hypothetical protein
MLAANDKLTAHAAGGRLAGESLANLLAVHLIRNASGPRSPARRTYGPLPRGKLRAVVEYVEEHLGAGLTLEQMAAVAHLSAFHFARQYSVRVGAHAAPASPVVTDRSDRPAPNGVEPCRREPHFAGNVSFSGLAQIAKPPAPLELPADLASLLRHSL